MESFSVQLLFDEQILNKTISVENIKQNSTARTIYEYFINILEGFEEDIIAFDIVYPSPETGEYNFISFLKESNKFIQEVQNFSNDEYYKTKILSLSSIKIEEKLRKDYNLKLKEEYRGVIAIKRVEEGIMSSFKTLKAFLFPFDFQRYPGLDKEKIKGIIEREKNNKLLKSLADTTIRSLVMNIEDLTKDKYDDIVTKFTGYLVWIRILADWKMYIYISVDISEEYNFGLVLLLRTNYEKIYDKVEEIINRLRKQFVKDFAEYFLRKLRKKAIINAMATIMSRNMSHNIGSHILFYVTSHGLGRLDKEKEINNLMRYLQQRMDFIAYISTGEWLPVGSMHLLVEDVIYNFLKQKLLLNYIGFSEGVSLDNLIIRVFVNGTEAMSLEKGYIEPKRQGQDVRVFVPLGIVGFQALYSILENLIRNSAKYGFATRKDKNKLEIIIEIYDKDDKAEILIYDNVSQVTEEKRNEIEREIFKPLLSETGEIDSKNWGLKEMKICALFLNSLKEDIEILKVDENIDTICDVLYNL